MLNKDLYLGYFNETETQIVKIIETAIDRELPKFKTMDVNIDDLKLGLLAIVIQSKKGTYYQWSGSPDLPRVLQFEAVESSRRMKASLLESELAELKKLMPN